jgi:hypothetical protein
MRSTRFLTVTLIALTLAAVPAAAYGAGLKNMFRTRSRSTELTGVRAAEVKDVRITVQVSNKSGLVQQIRVGDRRFTLMPNGAISITAPEGTDVFAVDNGFKHRAGDKLCSLTPNMHLETVIIH